MIKVCIVVNALSFGGVEKVLENYLSGFDKTKYEFVIIAQDYSSKECIKHFESMGFKVLIITHKRRNWIKNAKEISRILKNNSFDVIHANMSFTNFYVLNIAKHLGIKTRINHYHNVFEGNKLKLMFIKFFNKLCDKNATLNIFCSDAVKDFFGKTKKPGIVLRSAVDLDKFKFSDSDRKKIRKQYNLNDSTFVVGHIGRFVGQKNHLFLIDVFNSFQKRVPDSKLLLVGEGPLERQIKNKIEKLGLNSKVVFVNPSPNPQVYYQAMDSFVFPSIWEGFGLSFLEAQISGLHCVGSDILADEAVITDFAKRIALNLSADEWANNVSTIKEDRNIEFDSRIDKYDLNKCRNRLFEIYEKL